MPGMQMTGREAAEDRETQEAHQHHGGKGTWASSIPTKIMLQAGRMGTQAGRWGRGRRGLPGISYRKGWAWQPSGAQKVQRGDTRLPTRL